MDIWPPVFAVTTSSVTKWKNQLGVNVTFYVQFGTEIDLKKHQHQTKNKASLGQVPTKLFQIPFFIIKTQHCYAGS